MVRSGLLEQKRVYWNSEPFWSKAGRLLLRAARRGRYFTPRTGPAPERGKRGENFKTLGPVYIQPVAW